VTRYVALLGSINVGGNRLLMADLREALEREEFEDVETVVASGNVLFSHDERPSEGLAEKIAHVVRDRFGIDTFAAVRSKAELKSAIEDNPFAKDGEHGYVHTIFLSDTLDRAAFEAFAKGLRRSRAPRAGDARVLRRLRRGRRAVEARSGDEEGQGRQVPRHSAQLAFAAAVCSTRWTDMKTALVLTHLGFEDLGIWAATLAACSYEVAYCDVPHADLAGVDAAAADLMSCSAPRWEPSTTTCSPFSVLKST
jgi:uncharacterized protein (DUF1697 family)